MLPLTSCQDVLSKQSAPELAWVFPALPVQAGGDCIGMPAVIDVAEHLGSQELVPYRPEQRQTPTISESAIVGRASIASTNMASRAWGGVLINDHMLRQSFGRITGGNFEVLRALQPFKRSTVEDFVTQILHRSAYCGDRQHALPPACEARADDELAQCLLGSKSPDELVALRDSCVEMSLMPDSSSSHGVFGCFNPRMTDVDKSIQDVLLCILEQHKTQSAMASIVIAVASQEHQQSAVCSPACIAQCLKLKACLPR